MTKLKTSVIDDIVAQEKEKMKEYAEGNGLLQKIADGRIKIKGALKFPKFRTNNEESEEDASKDEAPSI